MENYSSKVNYFCVGLGLALLPASFLHQNLATKRAMR
jgi:hypothetical protein